MAHPVRPDSYVEINNFYTATVYDKGAEVVRMYATHPRQGGLPQGHGPLLPAPRRPGGDLRRLPRGDGRCQRRGPRAVRALVLAGRARRWSSAAASTTPRKRTYTLHVKQSCPPTPGQADEAAVRDPARGGPGRPRRPRHAARRSTRRRRSARGSGTLGTAVLALTEAEQDFVFTDVAEQPVPSLLRGFSAPVHVRYDYTRRRAHAPHGATTPTRSTAGRRARRSPRASCSPGVESAARRARDGGPAGVRRGDRPRAHRRLARSGVRRRMPAAARARATSPSAWRWPIPTRSTRRACSSCATSPTRYRTRFEGAFRHFTVPGPYSPDAAAAGRRALRNAALAYVSTHRRRAPRARSRSSSSAAPRT